MIMNSLLLRVGLCIILFAHSFFSIISGDVNAFGKHYLDAEGFAPFGVIIAWFVKLIHLISIPFLLINRMIKPVAIANILIFVAGIIMVHWQDGWFVVGGGRNGIEFNFLLIICFLSLIIPSNYINRN